MLSNFVDLMGELERQPRVYIGFSDVFSLISFLNGYKDAHTHINNFIPKQILDNFGAYISKIYDIPRNYNWSVLVTIFCSPYDNLDGFFAMWHDYLDLLCNNKKDVHKYSKLSICEFLPNVPPPILKEKSLLSLYQNLSGESICSIGIKSIFRLQCYIEGYFTGIGKNAPVLFSCYKAFTEWLSKKYSLLNDTAGWANILFLLCNGDEELAFERFGAELNEYLRFSTDIAMNQDSSLPQET